ncbi:MarR family transcriptional regulator [Clavibacter michiganensis]|uniref:MarR family winged helix-turn-helix transcriptional regulator n=1 Tax=Clavibacter michiganensis TaxID=28447 RepID=UPI000CE7A677|nr:MarR family transcriptional regulator [Clavibacter michiganensis]PPF50479.1 MarR family transcriptional regulator [Clavibacter michiganensis]
MAGEVSAEDQLASWPTGRLLSTAARAVEHAWAEALATLGVTHAGLIALHLLRDGPLSQIQLARSAHVETQTMSRTLERLEREGLVSRAPDPDDRRRHVVARTEAGAEAWTRAQDLERDVLPELTRSEEMRRGLIDVIRAAGRPAPAAPGAVPPVSAAARPGR